MANVVTLAVAGVGRRHWRPGKARSAPYGIAPIFLSHGSGDTAEPSFGWIST